MSIRSALPAGEYLESVDGVKLRFRVAGTGPVCILQTPGWGPEIGCYHGLAGFEDALTMVYLDTRGTGGSERPEDATITYENLAADVDALRELLGAEKVVAMGHSFGGVLSIEYALRYPGSVAGLVLIDAVVAEVDEAQLDRQQHLERRLGEPWFADATEALGGLMSGQVAPTSDEEFAALVDRILPPYFINQSTLERFRHDVRDAVWSHDAFRASANLALEDLRPRLGDVDAPAVVVVGSDDFICGPLQARWLHESLPSSILVEIAGVGHFPWLEAPAEFFTRTKGALEDLGLV